MNMFSDYMYIQTLRENYIYVRHNAHGTVRTTLKKDATHGTVKKRVDAHTDI